MANYLNDPQKEMIQIFHKKQRIYMIHKKQMIQRIYKKHPDINYIFCKRKKDWNNPQLMSY